MCRTIHCIARMMGMNAEELSGLMGEFPMPEQKELTYEEFMEKTQQRLEIQIRASQLALQLLSAPQPEGQKIVGIEAFVPGVDPTKVGVVTLAIYELASGAYKVVGTDHMLELSLDHTTPNREGLDGLIKAMRTEMVKQATKAAMVDEDDDKPSA